MNFIQWLVCVIVAVGICIPVNFAILSYFGWLGLFFVVPVGVSLGWTASGISTIWSNKH